VARRARAAGCALYGADGALVLPGGLNGASYGIVRYNLLEQTEAHSAIPRLAREGRGVLAVGVLAGGRLAGPAPAADPRAGAFDFLALGGRTRAQAAVQFVLANESVSAALVRVSTLAHLEELLGAFAAPPLSGRELERIFETWAHRHDPGP
jgi:aryl-alcohol dehydrogenase-like predicted oxidoreductase